MSFFWQNFGSTQNEKEDPVAATSDDVLRKMEEILNTSFVPKLNIQENEENYHFEADLPGVSKDDVEVFVKDDFLVIRGDKKMLNAEHEGQYHRRERMNGAFYRAVPMPKDIDINQINAELKDGVLIVDIKKSDDIRHLEKKISIK